jgi:hypothetical protein
MQRKHSRVACALAIAGAGLSTLAVQGCLDRPVAPAEPHTTNVFVELVPNNRIDKIDLLFMIDNSRSMLDKQEMLRLAVPSLLGRLIEPPCESPGGDSVDPRDGVCPDGFSHPYEPVRDIHIGVISSSLGAPGSTACAVENALHGNDNANLLGLVRTDPSGNPLHTYQGQGFLAWDPDGKKAKLGLPPGESNANQLISDFQALVSAAGEQGCGYEASLESWYRFLVDPEPPASFVVENDRAVPQGIDEGLLEQRRQFLRPDSLLAVVMLSDENDCSLDVNGDGWAMTYYGEGTPNPWHPPRGTSACESSALDPCCRPCQSETSTPAGCTPVADDPACADSARHDSLSDPRNLRCFQQKRRFGLERLFPIERYVKGLTQPTVVGRSGMEYPNPLYTDLETGLSATRTPGLVFVAGIVGVPWQDIADDESLVSADRLRYLSAIELANQNRWSVIVGDPQSGVAPLDPLMWQSVAPRQGSSPIIDQPLSAPEASVMQNPINSHEYYPEDSADLQYSCIFPLARPFVCDGASCDCNDSANTLNPLCQQADGSYGDEQRFAKAYPGLRQLELLRHVGESGIVASICPKVPPPADASLSSDPDVGYNPAVAAVLASISEKLGGQCVPRRLIPDQDTGAVPCGMVEALRPGPGGCEPCTTLAGRSDPADDLRLAVEKRLKRGGYCQGSDCQAFCQCQIDQPTGADLTACQSSENASAPGYCYIDEELQIGDPALVDGCPRRRGLRFVGDETPRNGSLTFIACAGAAFEDPAK